MIFNDFLKFKNLGKFFFQTIQKSLRNKSFINKHKSIWFSMICLNCITTCFFDLFLWFVNAFERRSHWKSFIDKRKNIWFSRIFLICIFIPCFAKITCLTCSICFYDLQMSFIYNSSKLLERICFSMGLVLRIILIYVKYIFFILFSMICIITTCFANITCLTCSTGSYDL